jgi:tryptophan synthase alpha chain
VSSQVEATIDERGHVLIGYLPVGFPTLEASIDAAVALVENGVDILELGIPYSDPVMDGLVIQKATEVSLAKGFKLGDAFEAVRQIRSRVQAPVLLMTYYNPVIQYGVERFAADLAAAGGAGLITPDLIPDEAGEWLAAAEKYDLDRVFLAAPSSSDERLRSAVQHSRGFVYAVSTMGITGARSDVDAAARTLVGRLRNAGATHVGVGVGISTPAQVGEVVEYAEGAIVGSAIVKALGDGGLPAVVDCAQQLAAGKSS